jgi:hypothetical protein
MKSKSPRAKQQSVQSHITPRTESLTQPSKSRNLVLPLVEVGSKDFEELCMLVLRDQFPGVSRANLKRRSGQTQFGVDVEGFDNRQDPFVVVSCKCYRAVFPWEVRTWINDFVKHLDEHWKGKNVRHFILALTVDFNVDELNDEARKLSEVLANRGIELIIWDLAELSPRVAKDLDRVSKFFGNYWVDELSSDVPVVDTNVATSAPFAMQNVLGGPLISQIEAIYAQPLNDVHARAFQSCIVEIRKGVRSPFQEWFGTARSNPIAWAAITPEVRARGLTVAAMIKITDNEPASAGALLEEAEVSYHATDRTARAMLMHKVAGLSQAIAYIMNPVDRREREVLAAFQIENGEFHQALETLKPLVGQDATSEVMRLRAIATALTGKIKGALKLVKSAVAKEPQSAMAILTHGQVLIAGALANGISPQFGPIPNPISRSVVLPGRDARAQLRDAATEFEKLRLVVEGPFQREVEVWKLAALLLDPEARTRARDLSRALLSRTDVDPVTVIWCMHYGIPMKKGQIRKKLGDTLRRGDGTPAHVAALALMSSSMMEPQKGLLVIDQFADLFPDSSDFMDHWRNQFSSPAAGEAHSYPSAIREAIANGDRSHLMTILLSEDTGVENLISGSEALASVDAFKDLNKLRSRLVSTGTVRGIELAAMAAVNSEEPAAALGLIDSAVAAGVDESARMVRVRLKAHKVLGQHGALIERLESELERNGDPRLRDQLMDAYLRVGALDRFKVQAEIAIRDGVVNELQATRVAYVLRDFAPEIAKLALATVVKDEIPEDLAQALLTLSAHLGLKELQDKALGKLMASPDNGKHFRHFDSFDQVVEFIEQNTAEYRKKLDEWLNGIMPAAGAMATDARDYAMLFLAAPKLRLDRAGNPFPMLLRSGIPRREPLSELGRRPALHIDMGALLIADRLDLLDCIERCFVLHVPESLPEAIIETKSCLQDISTEVAQAVRSIRGSQSSLIVVDDAHVSKLEITAVNREIADEDKAGLVHALDQAHLEGHLTKTQRTDIVARLDLENVSADTSVESIQLSGSSIIDLVHLGALDGLSRGFPLFVRDSEVDRLTDLVLIAEDEQGVKDRLSVLGSVVARKLTSSEWKTIILDDSRSERNQAARLSPHARCLIEALPHGDPKDTFFWIEDRIFSRQVLPIGLDLPMVLAHLVRSGEIDAEHSSAISCELRRLEYLFIPIDPTDLLGIIAGAPIVNGELVENDQVADIRRWYARDLFHLRYLDQTPQIDAEGMITGEARRMLDLSHLAAELLDLIWLSETTVQEKFARSSWVWGNLRLDYLPSPPAADVPEARRNIACMNAMQVLTLPIRADLGSAELAEEVQQQFVDWAMHTVITPMADADPVAAEEIISMTAFFLSSTLKVSDSHGNDHDLELDVKLANHLKAIVNEFLNLLPEDWRALIADRYDIGRTLGRENVLLLGLDSNRQVSVRDVSEAMTRCRASGTNETKILIHADDIPAKLLLGQDKEEFPTVTIQANDRTFYLHRATIALISPDVAVREKMILSLPRDNNVGDVLADEFLVGIARHEDVVERIEQFNARLEQDFTRFREAMWDRVVNGGSIRLSDFALPEPVQILNFLGLGGDFRGTGAELLHASAIILRQKIGIERAVSRLCGIPIALPDHLIAEYGRTLESDQHKWHSEFESLPLSFARMLGFVASGGTLVDIRDWLTQNFNRERADLFLTVVRHSARQAIRNDAWSALPSELALCLIWVHADQITRNLCVDGLDVPAVIRWLKKNTPSAMLDAQREEAWDTWTIRHLNDLSGDRLLAAAVVELISRGVEITDDVKNMIGQQGETQWMPFPNVLVSYTLPPSGYWAFADPVPTIIEIGWLDADNPFAIRLHNELLERILSDTDANDPSLLTAMIAMFIDLSRVGKDELATLRLRIEALEAANAIPVGTQGYDAFSSVFAKVHRYQNDEAAFTSWVSRMAKANQKKWPHSHPKLDDNHERDRSAMALFDACYVFAWSGDARLEDKIAVLCRLLLTLTDAWPKATRLAIASLDGLSRRLDIPTASEDLLPSLLRLRCQ